MHGRVWTRLSSIQLKVAPVSTRANMGSPGKSGKDLSPKKKLGSNPTLTVKFGPSSKRKFGPRFPCAEKPQSTLGMSRSKAERRRNGRNRGTDSLDEVWATTVISDGSVGCLLEVIVESHNDFSMDHNPFQIVVPLKFGLAPFEYPGFRFQDALGAHGSLLVCCAPLAHRMELLRLVGVSGPPTVGHILSPFYQKPRRNEPNATALPGGGQARSKKKVSQFEITLHTQRNHTP